MNREMIDINDYTILLEEASTNTSLVDSCFFDEPVIAIAFYGEGDVGLHVKFDGKTKEFHHTKGMILSFYADKLHMSVDTLSKKVSQKMNISLGQLIRQEIISSAKEMLSQNMTVKETSYQLGFEEPNNFSSFFQRYTGVSPISFQK